jgi:hypothetical protein
MFIWRKINKQSSIPRLTLVKRKGLQRGWAKKEEGPRERTGEKGVNWGRDKLGSVRTFRKRTSNPRARGIEV